MANYISRHTGEEFDNSIENFAEEYSTSKSYVIDNLVVHEGKLYKCITATSGTWDSTKWEYKTVSELLKDSGKVKTVNNIGPNSDGNITINIPAEQVNSDWNATSGKAQILNKPIISTIIFRDWRV